MSMVQNILFILHIPPPIHGAAMMGKYIQDSKLINESFDCHYINLTTAKNLEDIGHIRVGKIVDFVKLLHKIRTSIRKLKPDLVYITPNAKGGAFYKDFIVVEMIKSMGCKVIAHYHNKGVETRQDRRFDNLLYKSFFKGIKVILLGKPLYKDVKKYINENNVFYCSNGIPAEEIEFNEHKNDVPHILFLSNLIIEKGILVLLDGLALLKRENTKFVCDIVGGETADLDNNAINDIIEEKGLSENVIYHGKKYGKEKEQIYVRADIFAFPTFYSNECFPLVILEAMQHHLPVVATNIGAISTELIDGVNGFLCQEKDPASLASCLKRLLDNPTLRKEMGENGYKKFKTEFTLEAFEKRMTEILDTCTK